VAAMVVGAVMSPACLRGDSIPLALMLSASSLSQSDHRAQEAPTMPRAWGWVRNISHHVIVTLDSYQPLPGLYA
jgi:hypothetical protein